VYYVLLQVLYFVYFLTGLLIDVRAHLRASIRCRIDKTTHPEDRSIENWTVKTFIL